MRIINNILIVIFFIFNYLDSNSQNIDYEKLKEYGLQIRQRDEVTGDSLDKEFYDKNLQRLKDIEEAMRTLPIDACHHGKIGLSFFVDTVGEIHETKLISGNSNKYIDSLILNKINSFPGKWKPVVFENKKIIYNATLGFVLMRAHTSIKNSRQENNMYNFHTIKWSVGKEVDYSKNCIDADFFYEAGLKEFKNENFSKAIYNFSEAIKANPFDLDAFYNLAIAYVKSGNFEKACDNLKKASDYGDENSFNLYNKNCKK